MHGVREPGFVVYKTKLKTKANTTGIGEGGTPQEDNFRIPITCQEVTCSWKADTAFSFQAWLSSWQSCVLWSCCGGFFVGFFFFVLRDTRPFLVARSMSTHGKAWCSSSVVHTARKQREGIALTLVHVLWFSCASPNHWLVEKRQRVRWKVGGGWDASGCEK